MATNGAFLNLSAANNLTVVGNTTVQNIISSGSISSASLSTGPIISTTIAANGAITGSTITASTGIISNGPVVINGPMQTQKLLPSYLQITASDNIGSLTSSLATAGSFIEYNRTNADGTTLFMNHPGTGNTGGFKFENFDSGGTYLNTPIVIASNGTVQTNNALTLNGGIVLPVGQNATLNGGIVGTCTLLGNIVANSLTITPTELGYLDGVSSNIQTQLESVKTKTQYQTSANNITSFANTIALPSILGQKLVLYTGVPGNLYSDYAIFIEANTIRYNASNGAGKHTFSVGISNTSFTDIMQIANTGITCYQPLTTPAITSTSTITNPCVRIGQDSSSAYNIRFYNINNTGDSKTGGIHFNGDGFYIFYSTTRNGSWDDTLFRWDIPNHYVQYSQRIIAAAGLTVQTGTTVLTDTTATTLQTSGLLTAQNGLTVSSGATSLQGTTATTLQTSGLLTANGGIVIPTSGGLISLQVQSGSSDFRDVTCTTLATTGLLTANAGLTVASGATTIQNLSCKQITCNATTLGAYPTMYFYDGQPIPNKLGIIAVTDTVFNIDTTATTGVSFSNNSTTMATISNGGNGAFAGSLTAANNYWDSGWFAVSASTLYTKTVPTYSINNLPQFQVLFSPDASPTLGTSLIMDITGQGVSYEFDSGYVLAYASSTTVNISFGAYVCTRYNSGIVHQSSGYVKLVRKL